MRGAPFDPPNVFLLPILAAPSLSPLELEQGVRACARDFSPSARPDLPPALFSHRVLRGEGSGLAWEIAFEGIEPEGDEHDPPGSLAAAIVEEARSRLAGLAEIGAVSAFVDVARPTPGRGFSRPSSNLVPFAGEDLPGWEAYAADADGEEAGAAIPDEILDEIRGNRDAVPVEPGLKRWGSGHVYGGGSDKDHVAYLRAYLEDRAARASLADRRKILAFAAFQAREGSTAAINTYDNQIVTWGTGWGGLGWLGKVMERAVADEALRDALGRSGVRYRGRNVYDVVDLDAAEVVTGTREALLALRASLPLLYLLIDVARHPDTRDATTEAQLLTFMEGSANIAGAEAIATQALFNFVAHLKHWAPGYVTGCLEWAVPQVGGAPSPDRDRVLARLVGRYFYGRARKFKWIPDWKQFQLYYRHMKEDGLDCLADPFIQAAAPPAEDPFAGAPPPAPASVAQRPARAAVATGLRNPPLAGVPELAGIATGAGALRRGAQGAGVKALQEALIALGLDVPGGADGAFGPGLERAVRAFQTSRGLGADGVAGRSTLRAIDEALGQTGA